MKVAIAGVWGVFQNTPKRDEGPADRLVSLESACLQRSLFWLLDACVMLARPRSDMSCMQSMVQLWRDIGYRTRLLVEEPCTAELG